MKEMIGKSTLVRGGVYAERV